MENTYYHSDHETARRPQTFREIKATARENLLGNYKYIIIIALFIQIVGSLFNSFFTPAGAQPNIMQYAIYYMATFIITLLINLFYAGVYAMHLKAGRGETVSYADLNYALKNGTNRFLGVSLVMAILSFMVQIPGLLLRQQLFAALDNGLTYMANVNCHHCLYRSHAGIFLCLFSFDRQSPDGCHPGIVCQLAIYEGQQEAPVFPVLILYRTLVAVYSDIYDCLLMGAAIYGTEHGCVVRNNSPARTH